MALLVGHRDAELPRAAAVDDGDEGVGLAVVWKAPATFWSMKAASRWVLVMSVMLVLAFVNFTPSSL